MKDAISFDEVTDILFDSFDLVELNGLRLRADGFKLDANTQKRHFTVSLEHH